MQKGPHASYSHGDVPDHAAVFLRKKQYVLKDPGESELTFVK